MSEREKYDWFNSEEDAVYYGAQRFAKQGWRWGKLYSVPMGDQLDGVPGTLDLALMFSKLRNLVEPGKPVSCGRLKVKIEGGEHHFGVEKEKP